ncbi:Hsp20/alpha crystallin family protein [Streptomyces sp. NPDC004296]|uniref:Hsp20/alpha crystallin family protein n=1 Tax=Streptomyces sp. NPDC004296 TaxID=3364697 RepID=UPI0036B73220
MDLPIRHRSGTLEERGRGWPGAMAEFQEIFDRMNHFLESASSTPALTGTIAFAPPADLHETDTAYVVECELPGIAREDIDVEVGEHEVSITGELTGCEREGSLRRRGRPTGKFAYRALLPVDVKADEVTAALANGVLTVTVPKARPATPRHVEIEG